jgi:tetratricopeptide (TPR) repeat protein
MLAELLAEDASRREYWSLRANAFMAMERYDDAMIALECARRTGRSDSDMLATLGDLYLNRGQPREAVCRYREAFEAGDPSPARLLRTVEGLVAAGDAAHAKSLAARAAELARAGKVSATPDYRLKLAKLNADIAGLEGRTGEAVKLYGEVLREDPLNGSVLMRLGDLQHREGNLEEAVMTYERASRVSGFEARALVREAQVEVERERYARAVELLEAAQTFKDQPHVARYLEQVRRMMR